MPNPTYKSVYSAGDISAWAPTDGNCDHLFVWQGSVPTTTPTTLDDVLAKWNGSRRSPAARPIARSISARASPPSSSLRLEHILLLHRRPRKRGTPLLIGANPYLPAALEYSSQPVVRLQSRSATRNSASLDRHLRGLDDFDITVDPLTTAQLLLTLKTITPFQWTIYGSAGTILPLILPLKPLAGYVAVALATDGTNSGPDAGHPIRKVGFLHQAPPPAQMPAKGDGPAFCRVPGPAHW